GRTKAAHVDREPDFSSQSATAEAARRDRGRTQRQRSARARGGRPRARPRTARARELGQRVLTPAEGLVPRERRAEDRAWRRRGHPLAAPYRLGAREEAEAHGLAARHALHEGRVVRRRHGARSRTPRRAPFLSSTPYPRVLLLLPPGGFPSVSSLRPAHARR